MYLLPEYIGKGIGRAIKVEFLEYVLGHGLVDGIVAKTRPDNIRNIKLNESLGYKIERSDEEYVYMRLSADGLLK